ncbi:MAG: diguanylate cyclase [Desulfurivibrionaceae bacterium]
MLGSKEKLIPLAMAVWIAILGTFTFMLESNIKKEERSLALSTARALFQHNLVSRKWVARHGGVYVPVTATTQPNPYLPEHLRVLTTDNGITLTRINPSYMTRQMAEMMGEIVAGTQFHLTSLNPIRPENKATEWEAKWLKSFELGVKEQSDFFQDGKTSWLRYMAPLVVEPECLNCHAQQGYKEGDIRGGLSISLPFSVHPRRGFFILNGSVSIIGLAIIFLGGTFYGRKQRLLDALFNNPLATCVTDKDHTILMANDAYWTAFGSPFDQQKTLKCHDHRTGKFCQTENCPITRIMDGANTYTRETLKEKDGVSKHFITTARPLFDAKGKVGGIVESFQDITERKKAEKALEEANRKLEAMSMTDSLTEVANRRRFDAVLTREYARHSRSGGELSLIMLDIDHFKNFNDCYGHLKGDECLRQVAQAMANCVVRPTDLVARYGGEEFACILPETDSRSAVAIAEKIRRAIIARAIPHQESKVAAFVTASLGVATMPCTAGGSAMDFVAQADEQLYLAKSSGRNQVKFTAATHVAGGAQGTFMRLLWKDSFCCGNDLIDSQHQTLFHLSNKLLEAALLARPAEEIAAIISRLLSEASQHFHDEETILREAGFPGLKHHVAEHAKLLARGLALAQEFKAAKLTLGDVFQFLASEVIMLHILKEDREYSPFIKKEGAVDHGAEKNA